MNQHFKHLKNALDKQIRTWWDVFTLGKYVKDKITPRRLRWDIAPNDGLVDKDLEDEWFSFFNHSERKLLEMLIARKEKKLWLIEANINAIKSKLDPSIASGEHKDKLKQLQVYRWQEANEDQSTISRASTEDRESIPDNPKTPIRKYDGSRRDYERGDHHGGENSKPGTPQYGVPTYNIFEPLSYDHPHPSNRGFYNQRGYDHRGGYGGPSWTPNHSSYYPPPNRGGGWYPIPNNYQWDFQRRGSGGPPMRGRGGLTPRGHGKDYNPQSRKEEEWRPWYPMAPQTYPDGERRE